VLGKNSQSEKAITETETCLQNHNRNPLKKMTATILVDTKPFTLFITPKKPYYTTATNFHLLQFSKQNHNYSSTMPPLKRRVKGYYSSSKNWNFKNSFRSAAASSATESPQLDKVADNFNYYCMLIEFNAFCVLTVQGSNNNNGDGQRKVPGLNTLFRRFWKVAAPYWFSEDKEPARLQLAAVFALTLGTTGISVGFNFLGRDFYNALASKCTKLLEHSIFFFV
jgi:hypothetical protein